MTESVCLERISVDAWGAVKSILKTNPGVTPDDYVDVKDILAIQPDERKNSFGEQKGSIYRIDGKEPLTNVLLYSRERSCDLLLDLAEMNWAFVAFPLSPTRKPCIDGHPVNLLLKGGGWIHVNPYAPVFLESIIHSTRKPLKRVAPAPEDEAAIKGEETTPENAVAPSYNDKIMPPAQDNPFVAGNALYTSRLLHNLMYLAGKKMIAPQQGCVGAKIAQVDRDKIAPTGQDTIAPTNKDRIVPSCQGKPFVLPDAIYTSRLLYTLMYLGGENTIAIQQGCVDAKAKIDGARRPEFMKALQVEPVDFAIRYVFD